MSRNDQVTRQGLLLQALEKPGGDTIDELVKSLPGDFARHARTVRRDLKWYAPAESERSKYGGAGMGDLRQGTRPFLQPDGIPDNRKRPAMDVGAAQRINLIGRPAGLKSMNTFPMRELSSCSHYGNLLA